MTPLLSFSKTPVLLTCLFINSCCTIMYNSHDSLADNKNHEMSAEMSSIFEPENDTYEDSQLRDYKDDSESESVRWKSKGWNYLDTTKDESSIQSNEGWTPHDKTISLQFLDDDGGFTHSPPSWPHDEYLYQYPRPYYFNTPTRNASDGNPGTESINDPGPDDNNKDYEWKRLHPRPNSNSVFIGPGFYDYSSNGQPQYIKYQQPNHQSITDSSSSSVVVSNNNVQIPNAASESTNKGTRFYGGQGGFGFGGNPYDYYKRQRLRLKIHPGLIAAPIGAFAAYKAVSAFTSNPLLFELGWINNKQNEIGGGWGWNQYPQNQPIPVQYPNPYPNPYPQVIQYPLPILPINQGAFNQGPRYPILRPNKNQETKSAWWNPFAALSPRFRMKKERKCCSNS